MDWRGLFSQIYALSLNTFSAVKRATIVGNIMWAKSLPTVFDSLGFIPIMRVSAQGVVSSAGRASALQAEGRRFDPVTTHHIFVATRTGCSVG